MIRRAAAYLASSACLFACGAMAQTVTKANVGEGELGVNRLELHGQDLNRQDPAQHPPEANEAHRLEGPMSGNPLWEIPLSTLTATRERPIFSASRRPPAPPAPPPTPIAPVAPPAAEDTTPENPPLTLLGTVIGPNERLAVFLSQASNSVIHRRIGQEESGWVLQSIDGRTTTLEKNAHQFTLALPTRDGVDQPVQSAQAVEPEPPSSQRFRQHR